MNLTFAKLHFSCHNVAIKMSKKSVVNFKCAVLLKNKASPKVSTSTMSKRNKNKTSAWVAIGAVVLIILLLVWLTYADLLGDTDVAAFVGSAVENMA